MRYRRCAALLAVLFFAGCMPADEERSIEPLSAAGGGANPGLGPGTHPLSSGPGYKGSPSWSPRGDRIAFTVDGYVADKPVDAGGLRRWTVEDFVAEDAEWTSESSLPIFGLASGSVAEVGPPVGTEEVPRSVYQARTHEGSPDVERVATEILAMSPGPEGKGLIVVLEIAPYTSGLALIQEDGAHAGLALDGDASAVHLDYLLAYGEPEPAPPGSARAVLVDPVEPLEELA